MEMGEGRNPQYTAFYFVSVLFKTGQSLSYEELKHFQSQDPELAKIIIEENSSELWSCLPRQSFPFFLPWWVKDETIQVMDVSICAAGLHRLCLFCFNRREGEEMWVTDLCLPADSDLIQAEHLCTKNEALHAVASCMITISQWLLGPVLQAMC